MVLKDWKKTGTLNGKYGLLIFLHRRMAIAVRVQKFGDMWYYDAETINPRVVLFSKKSKSKAKIMKAAMDYMRKH